MHCDVIAASLIPTKPGHQRKHGTYDAAQLARLYRAGELTTIRIPSEAEERVRDLVRCRATLQREVLASRHYLLKFLARRGFVYREGTRESPPGGVDNAILGLRGLRRQIGHERRTAECPRPPDCGGRTARRLAQVPGGGRNDKFKR
jgi:transposase